jgi:hypothetical protein
MNTVAAEHFRWSRRKWAYAIAAALIGQALLIMIFGQRRLAPSSPVPFAMNIRVAPVAEPSSQITRSLPDPAAFALPNWNGFSRRGWLAFEHPEFKPTDWTEAPQWLRLQTAELGNSLNDFIVSNTIAPLLVANMPPPSSPVPQSPRVEVPLETESELVIEGELVGWTVQTPLPLPSWRHTDLLTNTVVHAVVNRSGQTVATALIAGSGLAEADDYAIRAAKGARFVPPVRRGQAEYASGNLMFRWHTQAPTNANSLIPLGTP